MQIKDKHLLLGVVVALLLVYTVKTISQQYVKRYMEPINNKHRVATIKDSIHGEIVHITHLDKSIVRVRPHYVYVSLDNDTHYRIIMSYEDRSVKGKTMIAGKAKVGMLLHKNMNTDSVSLIDDKDTFWYRIQVYD